MTIEYVQKSYYWIPRYSGADPETGLYASIPLASILDASIAWITDTPNSYDLNPHYRDWHLPAWMPQRLYINKIRMGWGAVGSGPYNEMSAWVDTGRKAFNSMNGAEAGSNFTADITLAQIHSTEADPLVDSNFQYPILCDRSAGDVLVCQLSGSANISYAYCEIGFLVPNT